MRHDVISAFRIRPLKVLIVDDEPLHATLLERQLLMFPDLFGRCDIADSMEEAAMLVAQNGVYPLGFFDYQLRIGNIEQYLQSPVFGMIGISVLISQHRNKDFFDVVGKFDEAVRKPFPRDEFTSFIIRLRAIIAQRFPLESEPLLFTEYKTERTLSIPRGNILYAESVKGTHHSIIHYYSGSDAVVKIDLGIVHDGTRNIINPERTAISNRQTAITVVNEGIGDLLKKLSPPDFVQSSPGHIVRVDKIVDCSKPHAKRKVIFLEQTKDGIPFTDGYVESLRKAGVPIANAPNNLRT